MTCVIIDDEPLAVGLLADYVDRSGNLSLAGKFTDPLAAREFLSHNEVDLLFIDIQMPDLSGLELVRSLSTPPLVVFTTAYSHYALEGFQVNAVDYLLKPIDQGDFDRAVDKALKRHQAEAATLQVKADLEFLFIRADHKVIRLELAHLNYIEGMNEYVRIHRDNGKPVMTLLSLRSLEEKLPVDAFMRVHKSYIVNLKKIIEIESGSIRCADGTEIPVSRQYKDKVQDYIDRNFMF